ncbi:hypothetical protein DEA8626_02676 [Defluviimonas aquaemixtae]|uniref:Uncharacterized protein n=1 Tax=Albidovulum aquaemixtae TaxID=1542388 RepID=A0A2R8BJM7_9RHOB|nr:hypothetical protein DEA8626_02676 [Defluviimonas aquaemixtae]
MFDTRVLGREQRKDQIDRLTIDRVKIERFFEAQEHTYDFVYSVHARMWQGDSVTHARRAEAFTFLKRVDGVGHVQAAHGMRYLAQILKEAFLAGRVAEHPNGCGFQKVRKFHLPYLFCTSVQDALGAGRRIDPAHVTIFPAVDDIDPAILLVAKHQERGP